MAEGFHPADEPAQMRWLTALSFQSLGIQEFSSSLWMAVFMEEEEAQEAGLSLSFDLTFGRLESDPVSVIQNPSFSSKMSSF